MSKDKKEKSDNYLDFIPVRSDKYKWEADEDGNVTIDSLTDTSRGVWKLYLSSYRWK